MQTSNYTKINNILGWVIWIIASATYVATVAPTASFWDCGEYIATSVKLQVGHPPGAPLFQIVGNFFSQFAGDVTGQAYMVNLLSAFSSSFSILFLFWTITHVAKKLILRNGSEFDNQKMLAVFGAGIVGALAFTWSDSFWYSAVEGEVYAMSSFFTAVAFWAVTKWERAYDNDPYANRWLVLIAYLIGLSVGVHILVFLAIPPIVMVVYYKVKPDATIKDSIVGTVLSVIILGAVFKVIIPLLLKMFGFLEITFVNSLSLMKNSGTVFAIILIIAGAYFGIRYAKKKSLPFVSQGIFAVLFILIGYSSFVMLGIRSNAGTPIDENNPEDALSMLAYYNREQYGDWPVMYGKVFNSQLDRSEPFVDGSPTYTYDEEQKKYVITDDKKFAVPNYDPEWTMFFPRMWSDQDNHVQGYLKISSLTSKEQKPTFADNFKFFMNYQVGHMYWRYFLWNFVGRQNDLQHHYERTQGNYMTGISAVDNGRLGNQDLLPDYMKNNPARNAYFAIPFILGLIGLGYQAFKDGKDAWVIGMFFLFTGLAIVVYTNHKPFEPRERDYAFVGSFYVFAIWIGLGVVAIYDLIRERLNVPGLAGIVTVVTLAIVPLNMVAQNWDDHDRSQRYMARDTAKAYLDSCAPNAILFTNGDNDTFPLWYLQEVEEYRTDVRVVNLSLLNTDWYIDQLKRSAYVDGNNIPFSFEKDQYRMGTRDVLYLNPQKFRQDYGRNPGARWSTDDFIKFVKQDGANFQFKPHGIQNSPSYYYYPQTNLRIDIDKQQVIDQGVVGVEDSAKIVDYIDWDFKGRAMLKRDLMVIDLINQNDWSRPIYFAITVGSSPKSFFYLQDYFRLEGLAYRFVPVNTPRQDNQSIEFGYVDTDILFNNLMAMEFEGISDPDVYYDETCRRPTYNLRTIFGRCARALVAEGKDDKAEQVIDRAMELMPTEKYEYNYFITSLIEGYYQAGAMDKADAMVVEFADQLDQEIAYFQSFRKQSEVRAEMGNSLSLYRMLNGMSMQYHMQSQQGGQSPIAQRYREVAQRYGLR
ncbi:protein O-mannosyl-transferase family [Phaeocystidibacter luteus]|uniref:DUF2723 domain-containing protein n=1 Tax=Phaeocystidibacter luteus TaxID=911197 RepID=A0A6N6RJK1_9FLAO|nr:DUF2723 domain-containing protein [Phaeocystidibacter luteus]KAB2813913.1 DUF2723 domain-containing protein [Phaeocystidibacter luteus]